MNNKSTTDSAHPAIDIDPSLLTALQSFDTPTICNAIELFKVRSQAEGYLDGRIQACSPKFPPMVGYAVTATFRASTPSDGPRLYERLQEQVESFSDWPGPVVVVFEDLDVPTCAATFGEVMCATYQAFGAAGLITSGAGRDLDQVEALGFPTFTGSTVCSHGYPQIVDLNVPAKVGGMTIKPGDLLHGDRNGVTTVPLDIVPKLPAVCQKIVDAEMIVLDYLRDETNHGKLDPAEFGRRFAKTSNTIKQLDIGQIGT